MRQIGLHSIERISSFSLNIILEMAINLWNKARNLASASYFKGHLRFFLQRVRSIEVDRAPKTVFTTC